MTDNCEYSVPHFKLIPMLVYPEFFMIFDVESIGLFGEAFAVAYVVIDVSGKRLEEACFFSNPELASGTWENHLWISNNVPIIQPGCFNIKEASNLFWARWCYWKKQGAILMADCAWPIESRFLCACIDQNPIDREPQAPYPLYDISSILLSFGFDPVATYPRKDDELPVRHPLMDARQSARILFETGFLNQFNNSKNNSKSTED